MHPIPSLQHVVFCTPSSYATAPRRNRELLAKRTRSSGSLHEPGTAGGQGQGEPIQCSLPGWDWAPQASSLQVAFGGRSGFPSRVLSPEAAGPAWVARQGRLRVLCASGRWRLKSYADFPGSSSIDSSGTSFGIGRHRVRLTDTQKAPSWPRKD